MEYGDFLNSGVLVFQQSRWHEITRRVFEGMACGKLIITDRLPIQSNIDNLFVENEDIVYYDSLGDCISKINYYLSSEAKEDRERISLNGYNKVINMHTQVKRVDSILMSYKQY
jgi:spore maturation protein CgeB